VATLKEMGERRAKEAGEVVRRAEVGEVVQEEEADRCRPPVVSLHRPRGSEEAWEAEANHYGR
jgi:hypothetical protein